jgi:hypothetical protein
VTQRVSLFVLEESIDEEILSVETSFCCDVTSLNELGNV